MSDERADATPEATWPIVTAWIKAEPGKTGASPVTLGVGRDGPQVGYYSGGRCPADRSEHELWLRLDPRALAALPDVAAAAPHMRDREAEQWAPGERQAVLDCINLYGDETLHRALDDIGFVPRATQPDAERAPQPEPRHDEVQALRAAAKRVLEADMRGVRDIDALNALEDAAGFSQQGQRRATVFPESSRPANRDEPH